LSFYKSVGAVVSCWLQYSSYCLRKHIIEAEAKTAHRGVMNHQGYLRD